NGGECSVGFLLPSPLWEGAGGGGRERRHGIATSTRPPTLTLPQPKPRIRGFRPINKVIEIGDSRFRLGGGRWGECAIGIVAHVARLPFFRAPLRIEGGAFKSLAQPSR